MYTSRYSSNYLDYTPGLLPSSGVLLRYLCTLLSYILAWQSDYLHGMYYILYRGIQTSSIRWIKPNMKNQIKKRLFFLFESFAMKKEFRSCKKNPPISQLQDRIIRQIKLDVLFFIRVYAPPDKF